MRSKFRCAGLAGLLLAIAAAAGALPGTAGAADVPNPPAPIDLGEHGWYFSGKGGPTFSTLSGVGSTDGHTINEDSASNAIGSFGMAAGYEWMYRYRIPLRTELEFMNRTEVTYDASPFLIGTPSGALASTVQNVTTMAKVYWHFPVESATWWPFLSAGLGWSHNTVKSEFTPTGGGSTKFNHASEDLAWSVGTGISVKLGPNMMNDIEIRQVDLGQPDWGLPSGKNIETRSPMGFGATELSFAIRLMF